MWPASSRRWTRDPHAAAAPSVVENRPVVVAVVNLHSGSTAHLLPHIHLCRKPTGHLSAAPSRRRASPPQNFDPPPPPLPSVLAAPPPFPWFSRLPDSVPSASRHVHSGGSARRSGEEGGGGVQPIALCNNVALLVLQSSMHQHTFINCHWLQTFIKVTLVYHTSSSLQLKGPVHWVLPSMESSEPLQVIESSGRVYNLKFRHDSRKFFLWMQETNADGDSQICRQVNAYINRPLDGDAISIEAEMSHEDTADDDISSRNEDQEEEKINIEEKIKKKKRSILLFMILFCCLRIIF